MLGRKVVAMKGLELEAGFCYLESWKCSRNRLHILSCYAPMFSTSKEDKNIFYATRPDALSAIPLDECFVMLGDFNAHVGSRDVDDEWCHEG